MRRLRIDEIPQFINILIGHMSFVGPRPERPEFVEQLSQQVPFYNERHIVKPGLTGWAQINYPYSSSIKDAKEKLQYDLFYIKNQSIILDISIILKTINAVFNMALGR
jgi:lipopolysaccharide/colanic/teichoic acid biosynthesis glycosyltransferase